MREISLTLRIIGWVGALSIVLAYGLLTSGLVQSDDVIYNVMNLIGGGLLGYRVYVDRNWANLFLELFFSAIAVFALVRIFWAG